MRSSQWKLRNVKGTELYNLREDVGEKRNLAASYPELVQQLAGKMEMFDQELKARTGYPVVSLSMGNDM